MKKLTFSCVEEIVDKTKASCKTCASAYQKTTVNGISTCSDPSNNCTTYNQETCTSCATKYFLNADSVCELATNISSCLVYDSLTTCS